ncbi:MAG: response regulator [Chloroflexi bacterium]|nr:response regulator [Chloroflexota bacterium]
MVTTEQSNSEGEGDSALIGRILVVDDDQVLLDVLNEILTLRGHEVVTAVDGQEAIELLHTERFDLIITDIVMPRKTGVDVLNEARDIDPRYPVIVITGNPSEETTEKLIRVGAYEFIVKPFDNDRVLTAVTKLLAIRKYEPTPPSDDSIDLEVNFEGIEDEIWTYSQFIRLLSKEINRSSVHQRIFSLAVIDIDEFERHMELDGRQRTAELARILALDLVHYAPLGTIIGRTNNVEYSLLMPETAREFAEGWARRIQADSNWYFKVTYGVCFFPDNGADPLHLLDQARSEIRFLRGQNNEPTEHIEEHGTRI